MKKNKPLIISLIVILSLIVISLIVGFVMILNGKINIGTRIMNFGVGNQVSNKLVYNEKFSNSFNTINIDVNMGDIEIKETNDANIKVEIYSEKSLYNVDNSNDLTIKSKNEECHFFCFNVKKDKVIVYIPTNYENTIDIKNNLGNIKIGNFPNATLKVEEDCGDVLVDKIANVKIFNSLGNIEINKVENGIVDIENNLGDIEIENLVIVGDSKIVNNLGDIEINGTNEIYIDAKTDLGDIDISNNYRKSLITLKILNDCGDIEVNN